MALVTDSFMEMGGKEMKAVPVIGCAIFDNCPEEIRECMDKKTGIYSPLYCDNFSELSLWISSLNPVLSINKW